MASEFVSGAFTATLVSRTPIGEGIVDLTFAMKEPPRLQFRAGQFVSMNLGRDAAGLELRRSFSIASPSAASHTLRFIVRILPEGGASSFLMTAALGGDIAMTGPHGFFVLGDAHPGEIIFGATGTGVAAVMPMLVELGSRPTREARRLFWGVRRVADLFARAEIEELCARAETELQICLTAPPVEWVGFRGRIGAAISGAFAEWKTPTFYLVGNGAMIADVKRELVSRGVDRKKQIRTEAFFD